MSVDFLSIKECTHLNGRYELSSCPVCLQAGWYQDFVLNGSGDAATVEGSNKVIQEVVTLLETDLMTYSDYEYPDYGSRALKYIGSKNNSDARLKFQVLRDLNYLVQLKEDQQNKYNNVTDSELILDLVSIEFNQVADSQTLEIGLVMGDSDNIELIRLGNFKL